MTVVVMALADRVGTLLVVAVGCMLAAGCVLLAGCSTSEPAELTLPPTTSTNPPTTAEPSTTTEPSTTENTETASEDAVAVWVKLLELAADRAETDRNNPEIAALTTQRIDQRLNSLFIGETPRQIISNAATTTNGNRVEIQDCLFLLPGLTESKTVWFNGTVEPDANNNPIVTELNVQTVIGCAPTELAEQIHTDYQTYWNSRDAWFNPPNPHAPELAATTTANHRENHQQLAERFSNDGQVLRDNAELHPEIHRFNTPTEVVIIDCQQTDPERGVFDAETGERTNIIPPVEPDQRDGLEITMQLEDNTWKVADIQAVRPHDCDFAPTPLAIPHVPPPPQG